MYLCVLWFRLCLSLCLSLRCCSSMRCLLYLDIQSRRRDVIWLHFTRVVITPVVCPRLFEFLTTFTFGAQRGNHVVAKKKKDSEGSWTTCDQFFLMSCQEHNRSWKGSASVLAWMRWLLCREKKKRCYVHDCSKKINPAGEISPLRFFLCKLLNSKIYYITATVKSAFILAKMVLSLIQTWSSCRRESCL